MSLIHQNLQKLRDRVTEAETRISREEDEMPPLQVTTERLQHQLNAVLAKQDDMENHLRRCNLQFVGLPEGAEGIDPPLLPRKPAYSYIREGRILYIIRRGTGSQTGCQTPSSRCASPDLYC